MSYGKNGGILIREIPRRPSEVSDIVIEWCLVFLSSYNIYLTTKVFQRRYNGTVVFHNKTWNEYKDGFGGLDTEFWMGEFALWNNWAILRAQCLNSFCLSAFRHSYCIYICCFNFFF